MLWGLFGGPLFMETTKSQLNPKKENREATNTQVQIACH